MLTKDVTVTNPTGLHARPAAQLITLCKGFQSSIKLESKGKVCDAKSIFSVLKCAISQGSVVTVRCEGEDEQAAMDRVIAYIENLTE